MSSSRAVKKQTKVTFRSPSPVTSARATASVSMATSLPQLRATIAPPYDANATKWTMQPSRCPADSAATTGVGDSHSRHVSEITAGESLKAVKSRQTSVDETTAMLASHLERFHRLVVSIGSDQLTAVRQRSVGIMHTPCSSR